MTMKAIILWPWASFLSMVKAAVTLLAKVDRVVTGKIS